jgi:hypothetical protein
VSYLKERLRYSQDLDFNNITYHLQIKDVKAVAEKLKALHIVSKLAKENYRNKEIGIFCFHLL